MKALETQLRASSSKDISIEQYFVENSRLGDEGQNTGIVPEKTYEDLLKAKGFQDKYMRVEPGQNEMNPCFFFCSGKYTYYANLIDDIKQDMWHQNRYIKYLQYLVAQTSGVGSPRRESTFGSPMREETYGRQQYGQSEMRPRVEQIPVREVRQDSASRLWGAY